MLNFIFTELIVDDHLIIKGISKQIIKKGEKEYNLTLRFAEIKGEENKESKNVIWLYKKDNSESYNR